MESESPIFTGLEIPRDYINVYITFLEQKQYEDIYKGGNYENGGKAFFDWILML